MKTPRTAIVVSLLFFVFSSAPWQANATPATDAERYLNRLTLRDVRKLAVNRVHYTAWCDDHGHVLDDGTLFRLGEQEFRLCCQERHLPWLLDSAFGFTVDIREETEEIAGLTLQGPTSYAVLRDAGFADELRRSINRAIADGGREMLPEEVSQQPFHSKLLRWLAYGVVRLLVGLTGYGPKHWQADEETPGLTAESPEE